MSEDARFEFYGKYAQVALQTDCWGPLLILSPNKPGCYRVVVQFIEATQPLIDTVIHAERLEQSYVVRFQSRLNSNQLARVWIKVRPLKQDRKNSGSTET